MSKINVKPHVITLGCRLNKCESDVISGFKTDIENLVVINTCSVTKEAARQSMQTARRIRKEDPSAFIIVTGCAVEMHPKEFSEIEVDRIVPNAMKGNISSFMKEYRACDCNEKNDNDDWNITREHQYRAYLEIQNGCNHSCTYCSIHITRGKSRSIPIDTVIQRIKKLVESGVKEVILTGVDITDYGQDLDNKITLGMLVRRILNNVPELQRLRLSSIDPKEVDDELLYIICNEQRLMPHIHMSLQAGDDTILELMDRRHRREDVIKLCNIIHDKRPEVRFGADIIAGFPGETEEMFLNTCNLLIDCKFTFLHVFGYSIRKGTKAAEMVQIPKNVIKDRAMRLRRIANDATINAANEMLGKEIEFLMENKNSAHSNEFFNVISSSEKTPGVIFKGIVKDTMGDRLIVL